MSLVLLNVQGTQALSAQLPRHCERTEMCIDTASTEVTYRLSSDLEAKWCSTAHAHTNIPFSNSEQDEQIQTGYQRCSLICASSVPTAQQSLGQ